MGSPLLLCRQHQENQKLLNWSLAALNHLPRMFQGHFFQDQSRQVIPLILGLIHLGVLNVLDCDHGTKLMGNFLDA